MSIDALLYEEIETELETVNDFKVGTDEHKAAIESACKLMDRAIEIKKLDDEKEAKDKTREFEESLKLKQVEIEQKDRKWKTGLGIAGLVVPTCVTICGFLTSLKFEETGTITTSVGRIFLNKLIGK